MKMVEMLARNISSALGDDFDAAFDHKAQWVQSRGGTPFRDVNMPFKSDYIEAAQAALRALEVPTEGMKMAGAQAITADHMKKAANYDAACDAWSAMIAAAREE